MNTKAFGAPAACVAGLSVLLCGLSVVLELPMPVEIVMIVGALLMLATAGALIGMTVVPQKKSRA
ncbi:hypothetical protein [Actinopolyspora saharensis]|uniref:hypothetical protein n=1 Tax=Actinopolyspora saharensis TaxID=995062 RepID=UPI001113AF38|nr:hypothetical protein [Actinopolyspora saharensis]